MSKRPRPADLRQPDLFAAPGPQEPPPDDAALPPRPPRNATPRPRRAVSPRPAPPAPELLAPELLAPEPPVPEPPAPEPPAPEPPAVDPPAPALAALPVPPAPPPPEPHLADAPPDPPPEAPHRPAFRRVDPLAPRPADRPDSFLYCVLPRDAAEAVLRDGLPDENPPDLVERGAVPRLLAAAAADLGWSDEQPGALVVLRVRRGEIAPSPAQDTPRFRRAG